MSRPRETESPPDSPSEDEDAASNLEHATRRSISSDSTLSSDPANKDAALNETIVGSPTKEDVELWDADQASFIRSDCGLKGQWVGKRPLGKGAFGRAGLWVKVNDNGRIIDVYAFVCSTFQETDGW